MTLSCLNSTVFLCACVCVCECVHESASGRAIYCVYHCILRRIIVGFLAFQILLFAQ